VRPGFLLVALLAALVLAVGPTVAGSGSRPEGRASSLARVSLTIVFDDGRGVRKGARLTCRERYRSATGFLARRDPRRLCREARIQASFLASQPDPTRVCPLIYAGPESAHFRGTIGTRRIDRRFARRNGCETADWDRVSALLPPVPPTGVTQPTY
jgi:hypothetical protein